jgi:dihydroflavonol-4-reductase
MPLPILLLTGGTGFLGRHLVPLLVECGYRVRLLVRPTSRLDWLPPGVELVRGDVTDPDTVRCGMEGAQYVVHAAGHFRFWGREAGFQRVNAGGTRLVAEQAARAGVERFVYVSTVVVVGAPLRGEPITEETRCDPKDAYQRSKLAAENETLALVKTHALRAVILRPGAFYGPHGRYGFNRLFIADPLNGVRVQVEGGRRLIFPAFVPDVARAILCTLQTPGIAPGEIFNICGEPVTHGEVNAIVSELAGIHHWRLNTPRQVMIGLAALMELWSKANGREPFYPLNLRHYVFNDWPVSSGKARRVLGFEPTPLEEGLRQTIDWWRASQLPRK